MFSKYSKFSKFSKTAKARKSSAGTFIELYTLICPILSVFFPIEILRCSRCALPARKTHLRSSSRCQLPESATRPPEIHASHRSTFKNMGSSSESRFMVRAHAAAHSISTWSSSSRSSSCKLCVLRLQQTFCLLLLPPLRGPR